MEKGPLIFSLLRFICQAVEEIRLPVYAGSTLRGGFGQALRNTLCVIHKFCPAKQKSIKIRFLTPTRLLSGGKIHTQMQFNVLIRNLLRRIKLLSYFHCGGDMEFAHKRLIKDAEKISITDNTLYWYDMEHSLTRTGAKMKMGGY